MGKNKTANLSTEESAGSPSASEFTDASSHEERAARYFEENTNYPFESVIVTDDGQIFPDTLKGDNAAFNYCLQNKVGSKTIAKG